MFNFNRMIVRRSWHLSRLDTTLHGQAKVKGLKGDDKLRQRRTQQDDSVGQAGGEDEPHHGEDFAYEEAMTMPSKFGARLLSVGLASFFILLVVSRLVSGPRCPNSLNSAMYLS